MTRLNSNCPDLEVLARFVSKEMAPPERAALHQHLADCPGCRELAAEMARAAAPDSGRILPFPRKWLLSGGLALAAGLVLVLLTYPFVRSLRSGGLPGVPDLVAAVGSQRPTEARLSGGFHYGPVRGAVRGTNRELTPDVKIAIARIQQGAAAHNDVASRHALALAYIVEGRLDDGIDALRDVLAASPSDARASSDLAAAFLARGRPDDFSGASDAAAVALSSDPHLAEAAYNRALALEYLHLTAQARQAWERYLQIDPSSPWAADARAHLARLGQSGELRSWQERSQSLLRGDAGVDLSATVERYPQQSRELVEESLLPAWARSVLSGREDKQLLARAAAVAALLTPRGDQLPARAVEAVTHASGADRAALARAHDAYARGRAAYDRYAFSDAEPLLRQAQREFDTRSPFACWARFYLAVTTYQKNDLVGAARELAPLRAVAAGSGYRALLGRIEWVQGIIDGGEGDFAAAGASLQRAITAFEPLGEAENLATVESLLGEQLQILGRPRQSWSNEISALDALAGIDRPQRRQAITLMAALACLRQDRVQAALDFQKEFLDEARRTQSPTAIAEAYLQRARVLTRVDAAAADADVRAAQEWLSRATERGVADFLDAQLALLEADNPAHDHSSIERTSAALDYFARARREVWIPRALLARARVRLRLGDRDAAKNDLDAGIASFETQRQRLTADVLRLSYQDALWGLFEERIALAAAAGDSDGAFAFAERARARAIGEAAMAGAPTIEPHAIAAALPLDSGYLYYATAGERIFVWTIRRDRVQFAELAVGAHELGRRIATLRAALRRGDPGGIRAAAADVAAVALPRDADFFSHARRLFVSPDGPLALAPFALLPCPPGGVPLLDDHVLIVWPNARLLFSRLSVASSPSRAFQRVLVAAGPLLPATYAPLPAAGEEAAAIGHAYAGARVLTGDAATASAVRALMPASQVIHLGTHAIVNDDYPDLSRFVFAPDGGSSEETDLVARDVRSLSLTQARLVVLAACDTADGAVFHGEGVASLARPFLIAGAHAVVGTLWELDDRTSRVLFSTLHRQYANGASAADALRTEQLAARADASLPEGSWAAAVLYGDDVEEHR